MTENKKKPVKKDKVENIEDGLKPAKKAKVKEIKEKAVKQLVEEEFIPEEEHSQVTAASGKIEEPEIISNSLELPPGADADEVQAGLAEPPLIDDELTVPPGADQEEEGRQPGLACHNC